MASFAADNFRPPDTLICPSRANPPLFVHCALYDDRGTIPVSLQFRSPAAGLGSRGCCSLWTGFMYYSTTRLNRLSKALATGEMLYDMARTLSLTRHRRIFLRLLTQHRFLMLFLFLLATLVAYPHTEGRSTRFYDFRALSALIIALSVYSGFEPAHDSRPLRLR